ncbi:MAG TPA: acetyl-CoA C-acyltransferase [Herpetosiphonaceae bacterium]
MSTNDREPVLIGAARTPIGKFGGGLAEIPAPKLGGIAIKAAVERAGIDGALVDEVIMGNVVGAGLGQAPARQAALHAGLPEGVSALTINKVCGSSLKAVMLAASAIKAGDADLIVAGGMENMSRGPYLLPQGRFGYRLGNGELLDSTVHDGLWCACENHHMGNSAEWVADAFEITREQQDQLALRSHQRAAAAQASGAFNDEIVPVEVPGRKGPTVIGTDEPVRADSSLEALAKLKPAFKQGGSVTAGNAPGITDGAAAVVVASMAKARELGATPLARITGYAQAGVKPLEIDWDRVNVNGGAVALGHPIGASGARVLTTLLYALRARGGKRGMAALCLGGGEAVALAIELI